MTGAAHSETKAKRGLRRPRVGPLWRSRALRWGGALLLLLALAGGGWWSWQKGWLTVVLDHALAGAVGLSARVGFTVQEILVTGRYETTRDDLMDAVGLRRGSPMLTFDVNAARERVENLPWVREAAVERLLPDTILLRVVERQPLALWQNQGKFFLIDDSGKVIVDSGLQRFSDLLVVVGEDAPEHTVDLLGTLGTQPELMMLVRAAVRVGARRWNLRLENGIDVRLPEENAAKAWARLAEYERNYKILARDVSVLDLRIPDRLIVRRPDRPARALPAAERDT